MLNEKILTHSKSLSELTCIMMHYFNDLRLSEHAIKAYTYARIISEGEELPEADRFILSAAAILHDIGIPQAIKIHGSAKAEFQEKEGALLVPELLEQAGIQDDKKERIAWLVGNHHTFVLAETDFLLQILMEADYLVNLAEGNQSARSALEVREGFFKTNTGKRLITALFNLE